MTEPEVYSYESRVYPGRVDVFVTGMECITCKSNRISKFVDGFGSNRIFCRNCWMSFPEQTMSDNDPRKGVYINVGALHGGVKI